MTVIKWKVGTNRLPLVWLFPFRGIHHALSSPALVQLLLLLEGERQTRSALRVSHIVQVQNTVTNCITHCLWLHLFFSHFLDEFFLSCPFNVYFPRCVSKRMHVYFCVFRVGQPAVSRNPTQPSKLRKQEIDLPLWCYAWHYGPRGHGEKQRDKRVPQTSTEQCFIEEMNRGTRGRN